jgi:thiol:disulfide interchange protein DsbD
LQGNTHIEEKEIMKFSNYTKSIQLFLLFIFLISGAHLKGQILEPAKWSTATSVNEIEAGQELDLIFNAVIDQNWYLYSSDFDPDLGPIVTEFTFEPDDSYELIGGIRPINPKKKYDDLWEGDITYFREKGQFRQTIKVLTSDFKVTGSYVYQVCSDIDGKCINFEEEFIFDKVKVLGQGEGKSEEPGKEINGEPADETTEESKTNNTKEADPEENKSIPPIEADPIDFDNEDKSQAQDPASAEVDKSKSLLSQRSSTDPYSLLAFMVIAFLGGLAALLTPCVFPMIPMTVSFFTGRAKTRRQGVKNALLYGFSIILIYTLVGSILAPFMGPEMANVLATHWVPNVIFSLVFLLFALSFFGLFEITLPSSFVNKMDRKADKGGLIGIFFMAFTLVLVSFSCTGPIVGSILVESAGGLVLKPILGMLGFSLAFAIPFTLFAIFPEWLNTLPKSGGWLNTVKVVLGFVELAFALKFLSVADQAYHWGLLDREIYLALWIVIFAMLGFYILGKIRLPHDSKLETIGVSRLMISIVIFSFVIYLIPGMFGAPLKALAGYLPPMSTHDFPLLDEVRNNAGSGTMASDKDELCDSPKYADFLHLPHGIKGYFDYEQAIQCAREKNKPLFIDFTGHGCVNCREMEARVWSDPEVLKILKNDYIVVALYVDDKTTLPDNAWYTSTYDDKVKKSIGKQNADFQITKYNNNAQPFYVLLDNEEKILIPPKAYDLNIRNFVDFLEEGKKNFAAR